MIIVNSGLPKAANKHLGVKLDAKVDENMDAKKDVNMDATKVGAKVGA